MGRSRAQPEGADRRRPRLSQTRWLGPHKAEDSRFYFVDGHTGTSLLTLWIRSWSCSDEAIRRRITDQSADNWSGGRDWPQPGTLRWTVNPSCLCALPRTWFADHCGRTDPAWFTLWTNQPLFHKKHEIGPLLGRSISLGKTRWIYPWLWKIENKGNHDNEKWTAWMQVNVNGNKVSTTHN